MKKIFWGVVFSGVVLFCAYGLKVWSEDGYEADIEEEIEEARQETEFQGETSKKFLGPIMSERTFKRMKKKKERSKFLNKIEEFVNFQLERREDKSLWVDGKIAQSKEFFVQKLELSSEDTVEFFTDIHASIAALKDWLSNAKKAGKMNKKGKLSSSKDHLIYMGDFVDRGDEGFRVLRFLMSVKKTNPSQMILLRGNHAEKKYFENYAFADELEEKYVFNSKERDDIYEFFDHLPSACFIVWKDDDDKEWGVLVTHGGFPSLENYSPKKLLASETAIYDKLEGADNIKKEEEMLGEKIESLTGKTREFAWGVFHVDPSKETFFNKRKMALQRGKEDTENYLKELSSQTSIEFLGVIRGHQHSGDLKKLMIEGNGFAFLWNKRQWRGGGQFFRLFDLYPFVLTIAPFNYSFLERNKILFGEAPLCKLEIGRKIQDCVLEVGKQQRR